MDRLTMAQALVARAKKHAAWIGDDHGDRYEVAMLAGEVDEEMQIVSKEILDHLRAALDYCARETWSKISGLPVGAAIYFPIARENSNMTAFSAIMNARMPGVAKRSPQALAKFASVQAFANPANAWLPELATLSNSAKHEHLSVATVPAAMLHMTRDDTGRVILSFEPGHGPKRRTPWMALRPEPGGTDEHTVYKASYLVFSEINVEVAEYIKEAISGVEGIIKLCHELLEKP